VASNFFSELYAAVFVVINPTVSENGNSLGIALLGACQLSASFYLVNTGNRVVAFYLNGFQAVGWNTFLHMATSRCLVCKLA
jgi:hypothetical protein